MQNPYITWINQQAILAAAEALRNDDIQLLNQLGLSGIDQSLAMQLKALSADRLACLPRFKGCLFQMRLDESSLKHYLTFADIKVGEDELINRAIKAGIRQPMLEELKGISRRDYAERRARMGLPEQNRGRIENLNEEDEVRVYVVWEKLKHVDDPLLRLLMLHEETAISLDQAYTSIKQLA